MSDDLPKDGVMQQEIGWAVDWAHGNGHTGFVPELRGYSGLVNLQKMAETDETIGAMLWVMSSTICQMTWSFLPCIDGMEVSHDDPDYEVAARHANFAESCLQDMSHSWGDHLEEAITMAWAGFAPCEIVFKQRDGVNSKFDDGKWGFKRLPLRDQHTIWDWSHDDQNELTVMHQRTVDGKVGDIPIWKLLHYRMSRVLDSPWGRSMLTNAWRPFYLKQRIQESEAIGIDREMAGLPTMRVPNSEIVTANKKDPATGKPTPEAVQAKARIQAAIDAVTKMRLNEVGGLVLPSDVYLDEDGKPSSVKKWDYSIITSAGQRSIDPRTAARDYDRAIARTVLMQFLSLGDRSGGSHGLSQDQSSMAISSLKWVSGKIANEFNLKAMPLLWLMNALPKQYIPKLLPGDVKEESIQILGQFLESLALADPLFAEDPALKDAILQRAGLIATRRNFRDVAPKPQPAQAELPLPGGGGPPKPAKPKLPGA